MTIVVITLLEDHVLVSSSQQSLRINTPPQAGFASESKPRLMLTRDDDALQGLLHSIDLSEV